MELKTAIYYRNAYAHFSITRENTRVYCTELLIYDGDPQHRPPETILLLRGQHRWWGSAEDAELVRLLGDFIDTLADNNQFFTETNNSAETAEDAS